MLSSTDYDKLQQIMQKNPENKELFSKLLKSHQMEISTISHEIRNPLTLVYSTLQLIESQHPEVLGFAHWTELHQDIEYMKSLLEDLSSYNNGERLEFTSVSTSTYFRRIALSFAASIVGTDVEFTSSIPENLPEISVDPLKLRQAILNLLRNAYDALNCDALNKKASDFQKPAITFSVNISTDYLQIEIKDNGCGITAEDQKTIFEPFVTHKADGTGLGLAITRRIIHAHHGTVTLDSTLHVGTVFTLTLPIQ